EITIAARPETIFGFLTDPVLMLRWKGIEAELDPRPGGIYRVKINGQAIVSGRYVAVEPYRRVVFTWGWEGDGQPVSPGSSTVEVLLTPEGDRTRLRLIHRDLPVAARAEHLHGWDHFLSRLAIVAAGGDPGLDPMASAEGMA